MPPPVFSEAPPPLASSASSPKSLILFLAALFFFFFASCCHAYSSSPPPHIQSASNSNSAYAETSPTCTVSAFCGKTNISYPFWLSHDQQQPSFHCGYDGLQLYCQNNNQTILRLGGDNYTVTGIDYATHTLYLADTDVLGKQCPRVRHNLTVSGQSMFGYDHEYDTNLTFFFNCTADIGLPSNEIACLPRSGANRSYVFSELVQYPTRLSAPGVCADVVVAPVLLQHLPPPKGTNITKSFDQALQQGFQLTWPKTSSGDCAKCEISGGKCGLNQTTSSSLVFTCFCANGVMGFPDCKTKGNSLSKKIITIGCTTFGSLSLLCLFLLFLCHRHLKRSQGRQMQRVEAFLNEHASLTPKRYKYSEVKKMTQSFSNKLGQGGYGTVYKGTLRDGHLVAVKVLSYGAQGDGEEFINEVASISRTSHVNIVTLVGFCIEGSKRALIYDFMPNGSLEKFISSDHEETKFGASLDWEKLHQISIGIARGLEYLHRGCNTRIVHFDIKPHNILLDQDFCPKIADFGLAKLGHPKESKISMTGARGTAGYIAPEVFSRNFGSVSSKSDVYSYGMMVLEMVGAKRRIIGETVNNSSEIYFPQCIYDNLDEYCNIDKAFVQLEENSKEIVRKMIIVGLWCIQIVPANRPTMSMVVDMLQGNEDLEIPPHP